jgi:hypothetical protein
VSFRASARNPLSTERTSCARRGALDFARRTTLQPSEREQNLRQTLNMMRQSVEMHLEQARSIQAQIGGR